jgi:hypothetical protein
MQLMMEINYNELIRDTLDFYNSKILVAYQGVFERQLLGALAKNLESSVNNAALSKRLLRIFIEIAQNISFYSAEKIKFENKTSGAGILVMKTESNFVTVAGGNLIENDHIEQLQKQCDQINSLNHEDLREYKRKELEIKMNEGKNSRLGFIQIAILSGNRIKIDIKKVDSEFSFIIISSKIDL